MSEVIDPPEFYFTGINFNPAFYAQDAGSGITEAEANALYLRKTVADTATAQETFTAGIVTPSVTSTGALNIVVPAALSTDVLNVGVVTRGISGQIHHYSDGDNCVSGAAVHLNNGINNGSNTQIMNGTNTTGTLNLMTGGNATGTVNIMTAASSGSVNIKTGNNSTGTTTIGQRNATSQTTTTVKGNVNIASETIGGGTLPTINIGNYSGVGFNSTTNIQGDVNIGTTGGNAVIQNVTIDNLTTDTIYGTAADAAMEIGKNITTGPAVGNLAMSIGNELTTGKVEIGKNQTTGGTITLGSSTTVISAPGKLQTQFIRAPTTTGITYINDDATGNGCTILGSAGTRTKISGTLETSTIRTAATNGALTIGTDQTAGGTLTIGSSATATTMNGTVTVPTTAGVVGGEAVNVSYLGSVITGLQSIYARLAIDNTFTLTNTFNNATMGIRASKISALTNTGVLEIGSDLTQPTGKVVIGSTNSITEIGCTARSTTITGSTMGINGITTITGATTVLGTTLINSTGGLNTTIGTTGTGTTDIRGTTVNVAATGGSVNVGTGALGATDYVSIASNAGNNAASYMNLGGDSLGVTYFRSKTIDINGNGAGNTSIGSTSGTGTITLNKPITVGYTATPSVNTQIGYTLTGTNMANPTTIGANVPHTISTVNLPAGVWLCSASMEVPIQAVGAYFFISLSLTAATLSYDYAYSNMTQSSTSVLSITCCGTVPITGTQNIYMTGQCSPGYTYAGGNLKFRATRIA